MNHDPYTYENGVLKNKFNITDPEELKQAEANIPQPPTPPKKAEAAQPIPPFEPSNKKRGYQPYHPHIPGSSN